MNQQNLILEAAAQAVGEIVRDYEDYDRDLVLTFQQIMIISTEETSDNQKRNRVERLVEDLAKKLETTAGE